MRSWTHAQLYPRGQDAEGSLGESQEDFHAKHNQKKTPTPSRVEQHQTKGYVDCKLHIEDHGAMQKAWKHEGWS